MSSGAPWRVKPTTRMSFSNACRARFPPMRPRPTTPYSSLASIVDSPSLAVFSERPVEVEGGADEGQVGEGLREVAQGLAGVPDLLGVQPEVVGVAEHLLEHQARLVHPTCARQRLDEPERAQAERAFFAREAVGGLLDVVAVHEAVRDEPAVAWRPVGGVEGAEHPGVVGGQEEDERHDQVRGVQGVVVVGLDKGIALGTPSPVHDLLVDLVANPQPPLAVGREGALGGEPEAPVHGDPAHELGVDEVAPPAADLPDPLAFALPVVADPAYEGASTG